jgi:hypothetical protein
MLLRFEQRCARAQAGFTFPEVLISTGITLLVFGTVFGSMFTGLAITQITRENLRATQIMVDKLEGVRLYNWSQINDTNFLQGAFTNSFFETNGMGTAIANGSGTVYTGLVSVASVPFSNSYSTNLRQITITLGWVSGSLSHTRSMQTYVGQAGMQNYVYSR